MIKLEELSYNTHLELMEFFGIEAQIREEKYQEILHSRPGRGPRTYVPSAWSAREIAEFETQVQPAAERFGYTYRVALLPPPTLQMEKRRTIWKKLSGKAAGQ